ncbi:hypothetical protein K435DRAFT_879786 [Dendrothele bispora CBS 962.96]|uniref:Uncharacterized protein n=1 Tax=Dendrothele bispora (strain CBS 962.96) TaxID=1314807 RepID=A0A4S8KKN0_DENBC|nr:hypothetical protein K435DRAFT_879786 [Dendrothele bispora CBS 962.96]
MGDVGMGLAYLCGGCCCFKDTDPGPEGQQISRSTKHPKERLIDEEFAARQYRKDKDGRIRFQPTPNSSMMLDGASGVTGVGRVEDGSSPEQTQSAA